MKQALYRKYRPKTFDEVKGQDNIVNILKNQIINKQISHAYIFSGTRGTGKTSTAKIFAKAVNCLNHINGNPCNECENCKAVIEEKSMDIVEMDAASNRRIDDIRQLRDQVIYPPTILKYKVYIIDEAHMITNEGFNALLKIMEEPPKHLIFILATTEIDAIPDTILSRTQRFEFKSISSEDIKNQIEIILEKENIDIEDRAVDIIANINIGAMRDALSTLDQVISIGKSHISAEDVYDLLGIFSDEIKIKYSKAVFSKDVESLISIIENEIEKGKNPNRFMKELIAFFKDLIYIKIGRKSYDFDNIVADISINQLVNSVDILLEYEEIMKKSDSQSLLLILASIRLIDYMPRKNLEAKIKTLEERIAFLEKNGVKSSNLAENVGTKEEDTAKYRKIPILKNDGSNLKEILDYDAEKTEDVEISKLKKIPILKNTGIKYDKEENLRSQNENEEFVDKKEKKIDEIDSKLEDNNLENKKINSQENDFEENLKENFEENIEENLEENQNDDLHADSKLLLDIIEKDYSLVNVMLKGLKKIENRLEKIIFYIDNQHFSMSLGMKYFLDKAVDDLSKISGKKYTLECKLYDEKTLQDKDDTKIEKLQNLFDNNIKIKDKK